MKRSPIKRKTPLKPSRKPIKRSGRPNPISRKNRQREAELAKNRPIVIERARGFCERPGCGKPGSDVHHIVPRSRGGGHDVENLILLCAEDHRWAHAHPIEATEIGLLARRSRE